MMKILPKLLMNPTMSNEQIRLLAREIAAELHRLQNRQLDADFQRTLPIEDILKQWRSEDERERRERETLETA